MAKQILSEEFRRMQKLAGLLTENQTNNGILSEGLSYHLDANKPLTDHLYRAGSTAYFNLWAEARSYYSRGIIDISNEDDLSVLTETNLGHFGMFEGKKVPLDFPIELNEQMDIYDDIANMEFGMDYDQLGDNEKEWVRDEIDNMSLNEAKNDNKKLNKPTRDSSGGKAYKVYVKDPKTGNIKTVRFGSGDLRAKINDKKQETPSQRDINAQLKRIKQKQDTGLVVYLDMRNY
jgi:hypothetical protein